MASPPKPWELAQNAAASPAASIPATTSTTPMPATAAAGSSLSPTAATATTTTSATTPAIPARPASLTSTVNQNAAAYSRIGATPYGAYGTYGTAYSTPYASPYSRLGAYGGYGGGVYGGYGAGYGGYGGMYNGGMYGGMPGAQGDPNDPNSLTNRFNMSTQATFQMLEGIVGAFGGFAQMLESTYMATHSSFFAMVAVAEQFGNLRDTLGSILGIFTLMRWIRTIVAKLTGRPPPADATALTPSAFARFEGRNLPTPDGAPAPAKPSRKPLFFFALAAFGLPFLMSKVIRSLAASHEEEEKRRMALAQQQQLDPSKLEFCRVLYDFTPDPGVQSVDLAVKKGDLVAVLSKADPLGNPSEWWRCRSRDGRMGYLPSTFLELARRPGQPAAAAAAAPLLLRGPASDTSRANSLTSSITNNTNTVPSEGGRDPEPSRPALPATKPGTISAESFQKSAFYS